MNEFYIFLAFALYFCTLTGSSVIILRHEGATKLFRERMVSGESVAKEPLNDFDLQRRQDFCDQLIAAREFKLIELDFEVPPPEETATLENIQGSWCSKSEKEQKFLEPNTHMVRLVKYKPLECVKAFPCVADSEGKRWFVAYDSQRLDRFLIENFHRHGLMVTALISNKATCSHFPDNVHLTEYFQQQLIKDDVNRSLAPNHMNLCFLSMFEHFRLCSLAFDALSMLGYFQSDIRQMNYVVLDFDSRCLQKLIRLPSAAYLIALVLPCSINVEYSKPQFYLLPDLKEEASVFVLTREETEETEVVEFTLEKVVNIDMLIGIDYTSPQHRKTGYISAKRKRDEGEGPSNAD